MHQSHFTSMIAKFFDELVLFANVFEATGSALRAASKRCEFCHDRGVPEARSS